MLLYCATLLRINTYSGSQDPLTFSRTKLTFFREVQRGIFKNGRGQIKIELTEKESV